MALKIAYHRFTKHTDYSSYMAISVSTYRRLAERDDTRH